MEYVDALLINPYWSKLSEGIEHLGLGYMAACARKQGLTIEIVDAPINNWNNEMTIDFIKKYSPSVIGVSIPFQEGTLDAFELIKLLRKNFSCHITLGGIYPTFEYQSILDEYNEVDSIILGEGEVTFGELVKAVKENTPLSSVDGIAIKLNNIVMTTKKRPLVEDLDNLPYPDRDTLPAVIKEFNFASIITSRGCYGRCSFCSVDGFYSSFGPKYRYRSAKNVVDEMEFLINEYNIHNFMINDANFIGGIGRGRDRAYEVAHEIIHRGLEAELRIQCRANDIDKDLFSILKDAGLTRVYIGIESGSQPQLDRYNKDITVEENLKALSILNELGLFAKIGFIMFDRDASFDDLMNNITFIKKVKTMFDKDNLGYIYPVSKLLPLSGSAVKNTLLQEGALTGSYKDYSYSFKDKKVEMFYKFMQKTSNGIWDFKSKIKNDDSDTKDWTRGWKTWNE
jgi:anaerobic magnesium-protoporphyrin IX monomethyl ester cyclase